MIESTEFKLVLFRVKCHREMEKYTWLFPLHSVFILPYATTATSVYNKYVCLCVHRCMCGCGCRLSGYSEKTKILKQQHILALTWLSLHEWRSSGVSG